MENFQHFKLYLPNAICHLSTFRLKVYREKSNEAGTKLDELNFILGDENGPELMRNREKIQTTVFRNPSKTHYYVALAQEAFADIIFAWIETVSDSFILHSSCIHQLLKAFCRLETPDLVQDCDEEQDARTFQRGDDTKSEDLDQYLCSTFNKKDYVASRSMSDSSSEASSISCQVWKFFGYHFYVVGNL